ncbi:MAG: SIMPL domain-containing protein [Patescibacteria group bacterium]
MSENNLKVSSWREPKFVLMLVGILLLAGVVVVSILRDRIVNQSLQQVTVNGQGRVAYTPNLAIVTLGMQIDKAKTAEEALSQLNSKMENITKAVKALGVTDSDIQTQNYYLNPQYDYVDNISKVNGYNANQQLVVKISNYDQDPSRLNKVIAAASKAGANQVAGLSFDSSNINDLKQQARIAAIKDAKDKSAALASAAGVELKDIVGWWENLIQPSPYAAAYPYSYDQGGKGGAAGGAADPQIGSGSHEVIIEVGVSYNLK